MAAAFFPLTLPRRSGDGAAMQVVQERRRKLPAGRRVEKMNRAVDCKGRWSLEKCGEVAGARSKAGRGETDRRHSKKQETQGRCRGILSDLDTRRRRGLVRHVWLDGPSDQGLAVVESVCEVRLWFFGDHRPAGGSAHTAAEDMAAADMAAVGMVVAGMVVQDFQHMYRLGLEACNPAVGEAEDTFRFGLPKVVRMHHRAVDRWLSCVHHGRRLLEQGRRLEFELRRGRKCIPG